MKNPPVFSSFWNRDLTLVLAETDAKPEGLTTQEAKRRSDAAVHQQRKASRLRIEVNLLLRQYKSPLVILLFIAAILSMILGEYNDSYVIIAILLLSGWAGYYHESRALRSVRKLESLIAKKVTVVRDGISTLIDAHDVVIGDIIALKAGDMIAADCRLLHSLDLHVNESSLTGESFPVEKDAASVCTLPSLAAAKNAVFKGTSVVTGTGQALAVQVGSGTEWDKIGASLQMTAPPSAFERSIHAFGYTLMRITVAIALFVLVLNILFHKPAVDSLLFGLAIAIGITPELLPAIMTITLAAGARRMASKKVIVRSLNAIQNLGQINVLCTDKTGTITQGAVSVKMSIDADGSQSALTSLYAFLNATLQTGFPNAIDEAIRGITNVSVNGYDKLDEIPYDFQRKRLSILVHNGGRNIMITKGAFNDILAICEGVEIDNEHADLSAYKSRIVGLNNELNSQGYRTIAVCYKQTTSRRISREDENKLTFLGLVVLYDPPKKDIAATLMSLKKAGVSVKMISGDNHLVAAQVAQSINLRADNLLTGNMITVMDEPALVRKVPEVDVFAEIEPMQKTRIVNAYRRAGKTVGFIGDGINDVSAIHAADVGISVDNAMDVAREAAGIVLLEKQLDVLLDGILEGRRTFSNTLKYIYLTTSANFGNMFSMAAISLFIPFLPLTPIQILLNNFLSDFPAMTLPTDRVDSEDLATPVAWHERLVWRFMIVFGLISSLFDFVTFYSLKYLFHADPTLFRTGWFIESLLTEIIILLVIRTRHNAFSSKPSRYLITAVVLATSVTVLIPYLGPASLAGLKPLPGLMLLSMLAIAAAYFVFSEMAKRIFFRRAT